MMDVFEQVWEKLKMVSKFEYRVSTLSGSITGWDGSAVGSVEVRCEENWIHFSETCLFKPDDGDAEMSLRNEYRWVRLDDHRISLEHRRREEPVHLVDLVPAIGGKASMVSKSAHLCGADTYELNVQLLDRGIEAEWKICGPKKNELILYRYF